MPKNSAKEQCAEKNNVAECRAHMMETVLETRLPELIKNKTVYQKNRKTVSNLCSMEMAEKDSPSSLLPSMLHSCIFVSVFFNAIHGAMIPSKATGGDAAANRPS